MATKATQKSAAKTAKTTKTTQKSASAKSEASTKTPADEPKKKVTRLAAVKRASHPKVMVRGFVDFLREQSVVGLAIGLVMGTQVKQLVDSLLNSFINPLIGLLLPGQGSLNQKVFVVHFRHKAADFTWGSFVFTLISFITVAAVIYFVFKALKLDKLTKKKDADKK